MNITNEEILKLAKISGISIAQEEIQEVKKNISSILEYASTLKDIAAKSNVKEIYDGQVNILRPDIVVRTEPRPILDQAPLIDNDFFVVPAIIKQD